MWPSKLLEDIRDEFSNRKAHIKKYLPMAAVAVLAIFFLIQYPVQLGRLALHMVSPPASNDTTNVDLIRKEIAILNKKIESKMPKNHYLVINTAKNEFSLYKGEELIKTDKCSTGSYVLLKRSDKEQWMFKTPKGEFKIRNKTSAPVWKKPDWAFVEEGLPIPSYNHPSRFEYGVLGDYSLSLGDGYLIHGTLYQRFLGLPVTHGCVRLSDENLKLVYNKMNIGSKVFIY